ncbi:hypothetical protein Ancab_028645 [Ancistrocladus abbreviatus]
MDSETSEPTKQERLRTRWTAPLDKIFADLVVEQIQLGNRPNDIFDKKTWGLIRDEFNRQTGLNFNNNQLRKHLDVLRTRYNNLKSALDQNEFAVDDSCCIGFDLWEGMGVQSRHEPVKIKDCPIYEQLCTIFADNGAIGKYAQSSHYEELENKGSGMSSAGLQESEAPQSEAAASSRSIEGNTGLAEKPTTKILSENKRKRPSDTRPVGQSRTDQELTDVMAEAMFDMISSSRLREVAAVPNDKFSITNCINMLDEIEGIDQSIYFIALDLFENPGLRETFISLNSNDRRLQWLQHKCNNASIH